jgi:hypothetical protein
MSEICLSVLRENQKKKGLLCNRSETPISHRFGPRGEGKTLLVTHQHGKGKARGGPGEKCIRVTILFSYRVQVMTLSKKEPEKKPCQQCNLNRIKYVQG